jgi:primary-amine oxidase
MSRSPFSLTRGRFVALTASVATIPELLATPAQAALPAAPAVRALHPLDPLTATEYAVVKAVVATRPELGPRTSYVWAQLHEPPKSDVLAFEPGAAFDRKAFVVALSPEHRTSYEMIVDLTASSILSFKDLGNLQPFLAESEYTRADEIVDASPEVRAALEKRGYTIDGKISDRFFTDAYAPGVDADLVRDTKTIRAVRVLFADRQGGGNDYGPYVEGLMALIDIYAGTVIAVRDFPGAPLTVKVPEDIFNRAVLGPSRPERALHIAPATAGSLQVTGYHLRWNDWDFRYSFNQREGLVLHQIGFVDGDSLRSICYRAAVSEMFVPYADPAPEWVWREFFDGGEYGLGFCAVEVRPGKELPDNAVTLGVLAPGEDLSADLLPNRIFLFERDAGALFAHAQPGDNRHIYARAKELSIGFVATVGNYDYMFSWIFRQDGSFGFEASLQGLILHKTVAAMTSEDAAGEYGTLVSPQILGVTHQHWINLRLDFDIDGTNNAVEEHNVTTLPFDPKTNPAGRAIVARQTLFHKAADAIRRTNDATDRTWVVFNPSKRSAIGNLAGYEIVPGNNTFSSIPQSRYGEPSSFVQRHFWATRYDPEQLYAAGKYPNQYPDGYNDGLVRYADDRSIENQDVVVWYSMGFTHVTRPEDFPIMPGETLAVNFKPRNFFEKTAALGYAHIDQTT